MNKKYKKEANTQLFTNYVKHDIITIAVLVS